MSIEYLMGLLRALLEYMGVWDTLVTAITLLIIISTAKIVIDNLRS